jgi:iron complex outermembrane receptor protein
MLNSAFTANVSANYNGDRLKVAFGEMFLYYDGNHFGNVIWAKDSAGFDANHYEWYRNKGVKVDATTYAKLDYEFSPRWNIYADLQLRLIDYKVFGLADDLFDMDFHEFYPFFNPKVGVNYRMDDRQRLYLVAGLSHREPTRSDIKDAIGNADTIKAETMLDIELGYNYTAQRFAFGINGYAMLYKDQLTPSGDLSSSGYSLMENVDKSYRLGVELVGGYRFTDWLRFDANLTLSMNKIVDYTYTDFADGDTLLTTYTANTDLSFSPNVVGAAIATFEPIKDLKLQLSGKYVGSQYLDNTSREVYKQEAYFLLNFKAGYTWHLKNNNEVEAQFVVNNLLNRMYRIGAWAGDYEWGGYYHSCGWYQQPGINCLGRLAVRF